MLASADEKSSDHIPAVQKAIRLMQAVAAGDGTRSMNELARDLAIAPTTCFRLIRTLVAAQWLRPTEAGGYLPGSGLLPLVEPLRPVRQLAAAAAPVLERVARDVGLSVKLSVREGLWQTTVARAESPRPMAVTGRVGSRFPVVAGASGAALLVDLPDERIARFIEKAAPGDWQQQPVQNIWRRLEHVRRHGWCASVGEHPAGLESVATPVRDQGSAAVAALTIIGMTGDLAEKRTQQQARRRLQAAADDLTHALTAGDLSP